MPSRAVRFARTLPERVAAAHIVPRTPKNASDEQRWANIHASARLLGLSAHGSMNLRHHWQHAPRPEIESRAHELLLAARTAVQGANVTDPQRLHATLGHFSAFCAYLPGRDMFMRPRVRGDLEAEAYNEESFAMFAQYLRQAATPQIKAGTVQTHVSTLRIFIEREMAVTLLPPSREQPLLPRLFKSMRRDDGVGDRALRLGLRARHLRALLQHAKHAWRLDTSTTMGILNWAILVVGHNILIRGAEFGCADRAIFDALRGMLSLTSVVFGVINRGGQQRRVAVLWLHPAKDRQYNLKPVPMLIARRGDEHGPPDPLCAYTALLRLYHARERTLPPCPVGCTHKGSHRKTCPRALSPLFATTDGQPVRTAYVRELVRYAAQLLGLPPALFGAPSLRIGGATDMYALMGEDGKRVTKERGRWESDVAEVYQRANAEKHLAASEHIAEVQGVDLESFTIGWATASYAQFA